MTHKATMWRSEHLYYGTIEQLAHMLFDALEPNLAPTLRLVGISMNVPADAQRPLAVVLPADSELDALAVTGSIFRAVQENQTTQLTPHEIQAAVQEALNQIDAKDGRRSFIGAFVPVSDAEWTYGVMPILRLDASVMERYGGLSRGVHAVHSHLNLYISRSLLEATVVTFLETCARSLRLSDPGSDPQDIFELGRPEDLLRKAGQRLMRTPTTAVDLWAVDALWHGCNAVAITKYEGAEARGRIISAKRDHPALSSFMSFATPIDVTNHRALRKLLEMTAQGDIGLLCNGRTIYGLGRVSPSYESSKEDVFTIDFLADGLWELRHAERPLMQVRHGRPSLPRPKVSLDEFERALEVLATPEAPASVGILWDLVEAAARSGHGTLLVISRGAAAEAERLQQQAFPLTPAVMNARLLELTSRIDGAVMLDLGGHCHAVGVILDGAATTHGNAARGSRYNSAVRYADSRHGECLVVVVSQDGMVDLVRPANI